MFIRASWFPAWVLDGKVPCWAARDMGMLAKENVLRRAAAGSQVTASSMTGALAALSGSESKFRKASVSEVGDHGPPT